MISNLKSNVKQMLQRLKPAYSKRIIESPLLAALIAELFGKSVQTIHRWVKEDSINLTVSAVLEIIRKQERLSEDAELLEDRQREAAAAAA